MEVFKTKRILALIGLVSLILGIILPYYNYSFLGYSQSISLWGYWEGKIILVLTIANALLIFKEWVQKYLPQMFNSFLGQKIAKSNNSKLSLIPTILVFVFVIDLNFSLKVDSEFFKYGLGFYLLGLGIICLIGHAIFYKKEKTVEEVSQNIGEIQSNNFKFCPGCGNKVNETVEFCPNCGHKF